MMLQILETWVGRCLDSCIFTKSRSIKTQMLLAFSLLLFLCIGSTLMICMSAMYSLAAQTYSTGSASVLDLIKTDIQTNAREIGNTINQTLNIIGESIVLSSAYYAYSLLGSNSTILNPVPSYAEYNFVQGGQGAVPADFGTLSTRSRFPDLTGLQYGSLQHSSVYLSHRYDADTNQRMASDSDWNALLATDTRIKRVISELEYQDTDMSGYFAWGPNTTVMFYLSACLYSAASPADKSTYTSVHRTFPGIVKSTPAGQAEYDPPKRQWFSKAPVQGVYLYGPYKETFTQQLVLTISSRAPPLPSSASSSSQGPFQFGASPPVVVSAAVLLLDNLKSIVQGIAYPQQGHGALVSNNKDFNLIVWGGAGFDVYDAYLSAFKTLASVDAPLAANLKGFGAPLQSARRFDYTDGAGQRWFVSAVPFFPSTDYSTGVTTYALLMLVFARYDLAVTSIATLKSNIYSTTSAVTTSTLAFIFGIAAAIALVVFCTVHYVLQPLDKIISVSAEIIAIAAEEEDSKDYADVVNRSFFDLNRNDEVGTLANEFFHIVCALHNRNVEKKGRPKYPDNPFHLGAIHTTWPAYFSAFTARRKSAASPPGASSAAAVDAAATTGVPAAALAPRASLDDLDVLGSLSQALDRGAADNALIPHGGKVLDLAAEVSERVDDRQVVLDIELIHPTTTHGYARIEAASNTVVPVMTTRPKMRASQSIAIRVRLLCALLWVSQLVVMVITVVSLKNEGVGWMDKTTADIAATEFVQLQTVGSFKAIFVESFFKQTTLNSLVLAATATQVLENNFTRPLLPSTAAPSTNWLPSYSMDSVYSSYSSCTLPQALQPSSSSGYYSNLDSATACPQASALESRVTSLLDFKLPSLFYPGNILSTIQLGLPSGYLRQYPYKAQAFSSPPKTCYAETATNPTCAANMAKCAKGEVPLPAYDATCRSWYALGSAASTLPSKVNFTYPRLSSSGTYVVTSIVPVRKGMSATAPLLGVINFNVLAATLSNAINSVSILHSGYVYLLDSTNVTHIVIHPKAPSGATLLSQAEPFTPSEFASFSSTVLARIQQQADSSKSFDAVYTKQGERWYLTAKSFSFGTVRYTCVATLPYADILASATAIAATIQATISGMIAAFAFAMAAYLLFFVAFSRSIIKRSLQPFLDLQAVCAAINDDELHSLVLPEQATSSDLKVLLDAFANLIIALRFGSESYARDDPDLLRELFSSALSLYTSTANLRGVGAACNNLGYVEMSFGNFEQAEENFLRAVDNARGFIASYEKSGDAKRLQRAQRLLSDREGNVAVLYLELQHAREKAGRGQGPQNVPAGTSWSPPPPASKGFQEAFAILEAGLLRDKQDGYIRGIVTKQGTLGQFYSKQGEFREAEKIFSSCLAFIRRRDEALLSAGSSWNVHEAAAAEQIALFNLGQLRAAEKQPQAAEPQLLLALSSTPSHDPATTKKTLAFLRQALLDQGRAEEADQVVAAGKLEGLDLAKVTGGSGGPKRIVFVVDYSGSMSGTKINSAIDNLLIVLDKNVGPNDMVALMYFVGSGIPLVSWPLTRKVGNETMMQERANGLRRPAGGTDLYDAILCARDMLNVSRGAGGTAEFIVVLTDGQDGSSRSTLDGLVDTLQSSSPRSGQVKCSCLVMGVGRDVNEAVLTRIAKATPKGAYIFAEGNREGIAKAFSHVAALISGQVVLEDV